LLEKKKVKEKEKEKENIKMLNKPTKKTGKKSTQTN
jgi:hypothetical protein